MSKRKPYNNKAGYVASRRNDINQGWVVIYVAADQGIDTRDGRYAVVCEEHSTICNTSSIPKARPFLRRPEFCEECMSEARPLREMPAQELARKDEIMDQNAEKRFIKNWNGCVHECKTAEVCLTRRKLHNAIVKQIIKEQLVVDFESLVETFDRDPDAAYARLTDEEKKLFNAE